MSTFTLSGSGTHALTAGTTGLQVTITTPSAFGGVGRSNPVAKYDQGLIRFSDGTAYWPPVAILGGPQFIPVPANASSIGYALLGGAQISVVEVISGTLFFSAGTQSLETLSDVQVAGIADGQLLKWVAAAGKWENYTPTPVSAGALTQLAQVVTAANATTIDFSSIPSTYNNLRLTLIGSVNTGTPNVQMQLNGDTAAHYQWRLRGQGLGSPTDYSEGNVAYMAFCSMSTTRGLASIELVGYALATFYKGFLGEANRTDGTSDVQSQVYAGTWASTAAINTIHLYLNSAAHFTNGTVATLYGVS